METEITDHFYAFSGVNVENGASEDVLDAQGNKIGKRLKGSFGNNEAHRQGQLHNKTRMNQEFIRHSHNAKHIQQITILNDNFKPSNIAIYDTNNDRHVICGEEALHILKAAQPLAAKIAHNHPEISDNIQLSDIIDAAANKILTLDSLQFFASLARHELDYQPMNEAA